MERAHAHLRALVRSCSDMEVTDLQWQSLSHFTPAAAQSMTLEKSVCVTFVMRAAKQVIEDPSSQIIYDLQKAWNFIIMKDASTRKSSISETVDAATLKWITNTTAAIVSAIDSEEHCSNADQRLLMAAEALKRLVNVGLRSSQYMTAHSDRTTAISMRTRVRKLLGSLEETITEILMGDVLPEDILDRVRLESECPVCMATQLNSEDNYGLLSGCTHALCVSCARTWFTNHAICPMCRSQGFFIEKSILENLKEQYEPQE